VAVFDPDSTTGISGFGFGLRHRARLPHGSNAGELRESPMELAENPRTYRFIRGFQLTAYTAAFTFGN